MNKTKLFLAFLLCTAAFTQSHAWIITFFHTDTLETHDSYNLIFRMRLFAINKKTVPPSHDRTTPIPDETIVTTYVKISLSKQKSRTRTLGKPFQMIDNHVKNKAQNPYLFFNTESMHGGAVAAALSYCDPFGRNLVNGLFCFEHKENLPPFISTAPNYSPWTNPEQPWLRNKPTIAKAESPHVFLLPSIPNTARNHPTKIHVWDVICAGQVDEFRAINFYEAVDRDNAAAASSDNARPPKISIPRSPASPSSVYCKRSVPWTPKALQEEVRAADDRPISAPPTNSGMQRFYSQDHLQRNLSSSSLSSEGHNGNTSPPRSMSPRGMPRRGQGHRTRGRGGQRRRRGFGWKNTRTTSYSAGRERGPTSKVIRTSEGGTLYVFSDKGTPQDRQQ